MQTGNPGDLQPTFEECARLLLDPSVITRRTSLPQIWDLSVSATDWVEGMIDHNDLAVPSRAIEIARKFTVHVRRSGEGREDVLIQRARLHYYQCSLECRGKNPKMGARSISFALGLLRPRQRRNPNDIPLALLTAAALHRGQGLADFPETRWDEGCVNHLNRLLKQLTGMTDELTPDQRRQLASIK